jgi:hypothetical protein
MKTMILLPLTIMATGLAPAAPSLPPQSPLGPAGYWEGAISLPTTALAIQVQLDEQPGRGWRGTISIPVQGLRNLALTKVTVQGAEVAFAMAPIPGNPVFQGRLAPGGKALAGSFTQAGQTFPFNLERKTARPELAAETPARGVPGQGLAGTWQGSLSIRVAELRLVLKITRSTEGKLSGTLDSIDQGAQDLPLDTVEQRAGAVHLESKRIGAAYDGQMSADGSEIAGEWKQSGQTLALVFKRLEKPPELARPQEPRKPYPYREEEVRFESQDAAVRLAGTLTLPRGNGPFPAVLLISGAGPQDRDEAIMGHRPFLVLADHLTCQGIAVLRVDDRGVGKSSGDLAKATVEDFVGDALAGVNFLKARAEIDPRRIGLVGHSEGGAVAPLVAVRSPAVAFIVLLAGVGVPMDQLLLRQAADLARVMGASEAAIATNAAVQQRIFEIVRTEPDLAAAERQVRSLLDEQMKLFTDEQRKALGHGEAWLEAQVKMAASPWMRHLLTYDPKATLMKVRCPVLALNGAKDLQVSAKENLAAIRQALEAGGNTNVETIELAGLNHLLQPCQTGAVAEYSRIEETIAPLALETIDRWIRAQTGK